MTVRVDSEIGRLRRVLVHRPGREIEWMVPRMMERLLFDDILYGKQARREHERFCAVMRAAGVETLDAEDLLAAVLADAGARGGLLDELGRRHGLGAEVRRELDGLEPGELAATLIHGVRRQAGYSESDASLFELMPVPNYFFQRDPQVVVADRVVISSMATRARSREAFLARALFGHHPGLRPAGGILEVARPDRAGEDLATLEGGDVLIARDDVLLVGISQRTNRRGAERLAEHLRREATPFRHLLLVELPLSRSFMHLDTVFTLVDRGSCLVYPPVVQPGHRLSCSVYAVDLEAPALSFTVRDSLLSALADLGVDLEPIPCGGAADNLDQEREQWTDGANAFALAPGVILLYRRNRRTVEELDRRGWRVIDEEHLDESPDALADGRRTVITFEGHELSRARGGPRCMTMPLERDPAGR